jgi:hypothetical protein
MPNLNRILYSMCYDMLEQEHFAYKKADGIAVVCPEMPVWLRKNDRKDIGLFFKGFLDEYKNPLTGIVAEKETALECAEIYKQRTDADFTYKEIIAFYMGEKLAESDAFELCPALPADMPLVLEWINAFYAETLNLVLPSVEGNAKISSPPQIFVLRDSRPLAMGMLSGTGETCRINLVYVPPELRGKGYGRALVGALAEKAREIGGLPVLYTACDNIAAKGLYKALGFREAGRLTEVRIRGFK